MSGLHRFSFGDLDAGAWGSGWIAAESGVVAIGSPQGEALLTVPVRVEPDGAGDSDWIISGEDLELSVSPAGEPVTPSGRNGPLAGAFDQLCRVSGQFRAAGSEHQLERPGHRAFARDLAASNRMDSVRSVSAWFSSEPGVALVALRPAGARGHEADEVRAALLAPGPPAALDPRVGTAIDSRPAGDGPVPAIDSTSDGETAVSEMISDPRFSTTYTLDGRPVRAGLELWLGDPEGEQLPRRAAGEALGASLQFEAGGLAIHAERFRWHMRGEDGPGVYLLAHRR